MRATAPRPTSPQPAMLGRAESPYLAPLTPSTRPKPVMFIDEPGSEGGSAAASGAAAAHHPAEAPRWFPAAVRQAALFSALDDADAATLRASMTEVHCGRGQHVFRQGESGDQLYVVADGKLKVARTGNSRRETLLAVLGDGEMFGASDLFDPGPRTVTVTALVETRLFALNRLQLNPWLSTRPEVTVALLQELSQRLRQSHRAVGALMSGDVPARVAGALLAFARQFGSRIPDGVRVQHDLTQDELAQLVGASREAVNKVLGDFARRGWIRLEFRAVLLLDVEHLARRPV